MADDKKNAPSEPAVMPVADHETAVADLGAAHEKTVTELTAAHEEVVASHSAAFEKAQNELAAARAEADKAKAELGEFRDRMVDGESLEDIAADQGERKNDDLVEVRVKTPMQINPDPSDWRYSHDGPPPASHTLMAGLNHVPQWVADHWLVKGNLADS